MFLAGLYYDFGKTYVDKTVLPKSDKLTDDEFNVIKMHPVIGKMILSSNPKDFGLYSDILLAIEEHDERAVGSSYFYDKKWDSILFMELIAVVYNFDVLVSKRVYNDPFIAKEENQILRKESNIF